MLAEAKRLAQARGELAAEKALRWRPRSFAQEREEAATDAAARLDGARLARLVAWHPHGRNLQQERPPWRSPEASHRHRVSLRLKQCWRGLEGQQAFARHKQGRGQAQDWQRWSAFGPGRHRTKWVSQRKRQG